MLDDFQLGQPVIYRILKNNIIKDKISHAYLFSSNNMFEIYSLAIAFSKSIFCPNSKINNTNCKNCHICERIDNHNYPEIKVIESDGFWIKKEQLLNLQHEFSMKPVEGNYRIYIIKEADKLNISSANSILKFLEEPNSGIIAILLTTDIQHVLPTILSRCQIISLNNNKINESDFDDFENKTLLKIGEITYKNKDDLLNFINNQDNIDKIEAIINFAHQYEIKKLNIIIEIKKLWLDHFTKKEDNIWAFDILSLFYKDVLNYKYGRELDYFSYYKDKIDFVSNKNNIKNIIKKIELIILNKEKIKYNINLSLLMDKLILEMEEL